MTSHPQVLHTREHKELILQCLSDEDVTLRTRALELLTGMASKKNIKELVSQLLRHVDLAEGAYKRDLVDKIIFICSRDKYMLLSDFNWYLDVLVRLAHVHYEGLDDKTLQVKELVRSQIVNVALRVLPVREHAVTVMIKVLLHQPISGKGGVMKEVLPSGAWIVGEYSTLIENILDTAECPAYNPNAQGLYHAVVQALLLPSHSSNLDVSTQAIYIQSAMKVFAAACNCATATESELEACVSTLSNSLPFFIESTNAEVQERAFSSYKLLKALHLILTHDAQSNISTSKQSNIDNNSEDDDDSSTSTASDVDDENTNSNDMAATGDLLSLGMSTTSSTPAPSTNDDTTKTKNDDTNDSMNNLLSSSLLTPSPSQSNNINTTNTHDNSSVAQKCRSAANTLSTLYIPEPMKPVSAKAQKRLMIPSSLGINLNNTKNAKFTLFMSLFTPQNAIALGTTPSGSDSHKKGSNNKHKQQKVRMEEISFTQQKPLQVDRPQGQHMMGIGSSSALDQPKMGIMGGMMGSNTAKHINGGGRTAMDGFGNKNGGTMNTSGLMDNSNAGGASNRYNNVDNHPFYLASSGTGGGGMGNINTTNILDDRQTAQPQSTGRFGTIQLLDDDDDEISNDGIELPKTGKKKKNKKKRKEKKSKGSPSNAQIGEADFAMLSLGKNTNANKPARASTTTEKANFTVYHSEDDDDDDNNILPMKLKPRSTNNEFQGLAQVDLTAPFADHEVMPENKHRQVPPQQQRQPPLSSNDVTASSPKRKKKQQKSKSKKDGKTSKSKKKSSSKKKESSSDPITSGGGAETNDLLDLGMFDNFSTSGANPATQQNDAGGANSNTVPNPFDTMTNDLLSLTVTTPAAETNMALNSKPKSKAAAASYAPIEEMVESTSRTQTKKSNTQSGSTTKRPWLKGSLKPSSSGDVDFGSISLQYKVYGKHTGASIVLKVMNNGTSRLTNIKVSFSGIDNEISIGNILPGDEVESSKVGPIPYRDNENATESSQDVRGNFTALGCTSSCKLSIPVSMRLTPVPNLTQDDVMEELANGNWSSHSAKIELSTMIDATNKVIPLLCSFLKANLIGDGNDQQLLQGTLAAKSKHGTQVRALVKVKPSSVKIDVKCSGDSTKLDKSLVSDLKRLAL